MKRKTIDKDFVVRFLNAIGRDKIEFQSKQEVLKNKFHFRTFSTEWTNYRMVLKVELGKIVKVVSVKRSNVVITEDRDWWDESSLSKKEKNPWDLCSDAARVKIDDCLRDDEDGLIKVERKWIITHNGVPVGYRLSRGTDGVVKTLKGGQVTFPDEACQQHDTEHAANKYAEMLRRYLKLYDAKAARNKTKKRK